mmetsp:Transcript_20643/g.31478  ORF Transcript_20643/g.31478 Transcript_20643/m.31478 type:complete len:121 (+) Transcript_20643:3774-4136(+)
MRLLTMFDKFVDFDSVHLSVLSKQPNSIQYELPENLSLDEELCKLTENFASENEEEYSYEEMNKYAVELRLQVLKMKYERIESEGISFDEQDVLKDREKDLERYELFYGLRLAKSQKKFT